MRASFKSAIYKYVMSPIEPKSKSSLWFYTINVIFFLILGGILFTLKKTEFYPQKRSESFWSVWVWIALMGFLKVAITDYRKFFRFFLLTIYARNRAFIFLILLNLLYFPLEVLLFSNVKDYVDNGLKTSTSILNAISYIYFYYLLLKLFLIFVFKKENLQDLTKENKQ